MFITNLNNKLIYIIDIIISSIKSIMIIFIRHNCAIFVKAHVSSLLYMLALFIAAVLSLTRNSTHWHSIRYINFLM